MAGAVTVGMDDQVGGDEEIAGSALIFSAERQEAARNILPTLTVAMNSLPPGAAQRPHRHNAVAVSLIIKGERCFSLIDGRRKEWAPWAATNTPPVSVHSHHNGGVERALFLIVQAASTITHTRPGVRVRRASRGDLSGAQPLALLPGLRGEAGGCRRISGIGRAAEEAR